METDNDAMDIDDTPQAEEAGSSSSAAALPMDQRPLIMVSEQSASASTSDNNNNIPQHHTLPQHADSNVSAASSNPPPPPPLRKRNSMTSASSDCVKVAVRIRPLLPLERQEPCLTILDEPPMTTLAPPADDNNSDNKNDTVATSVQVGGRRSGVTYTFDCVYNTATTQARLYQHSVVPLLHACLEGYNATILAYGQTGSGKTHTILGNHVTEVGELQGVLPRTIHALFDALSLSSSSATSAAEGMEQDGAAGNAAAANNPTTKRNTPDRPCDDWRVHVQFLEIYGEDIRDLLRPAGEDGGGMGVGRSNASSSSTSSLFHHQKVTIRDGVASEEPEVLGVHQPRVQSATEALQILQTGRLRRVTAATAMNATSSRSHALFTILVEQEWNNSGQTNKSGGGAGAAGGGGGTIIRRSKFHFVDLAGSERAKRTQAVGQRLKEGIEINKGLLVLGNVIAALASSSKANNKPIFVPYRDSKLTRLLRGSLGGNHKTLMIACVSPSADNLEESLNCLRYANRAKQIQNKAVINLDPTSQYILTLQQHITKLAQLALNSEIDLSGDGGTAAPYTREQLQALAGGEAVETVMAGAQSMETTSAAAAPPPPPPPKESPMQRNSASASTRTSPVRRRPAATSAPVEELKDNAEEDLYWQKAQNSMHQVFRHSSPSKDDGPAPSIAITPSMDSQDSAIMDMTAQKMMEYEREIGELKKALAVERSQRAMIQEEQSWMDEVQQSLQDDRSRLEYLQTTAADLEKYDDDEEEQSGLNRIEAEQDAEQKTLRTWTKKYTQGQGFEDGNEGDVEDNDDDSAESNHEQATTLSADALGMAPPSKHRDIQDDLMELGRSIAAKEELIGQLKASQQRYEEMREFYESKLREMENSLLEKEEERETLVKKLEQAQKVKAGGVRSQELKEKLREKEEHIAVLKKKSVELRNLTTVSSRNANEIARLTRDVELMKRRKVDLQKQLSVERKNHASQIKQLHKEAMQKERELTKYKRLTSKKEIEAEKANQIAKSRLEELGILRQKYKDTEKKLRVASVRRGVMAKAGLDPVLVGHRDKGKHNIDTNALRDLFDEKVSKVARKEALVNKLAEEWEQHFQLSSKRDEVAKNESPEDLENIELQLKYKEDRIRNLAKRLEKEGSAEETRDTGRTDNKESFLFDAQFERVCKAAPPEVAHKSLAKVLFGMVVRERRRVAALARTACSLDERLQSTVEDLEAKDLALRSQIDEQRVQVAEMSQNQQNQILSLMELVKEDANVPKAASNGELSGDFDETLLVLANERITVLEKQLETAELEAESARNYRLEIEQVKESLKYSQEERKIMEEELQKANADMRKVKELLLKLSNRGGVDLSRVTAVVNNSLGEQPRDGRAASRKATSFSARKASPIPSSITEAIQFDDESEAEDDLGKGEPDWANEIMEDLALIAEGKVPPSLKGTPGFERHESDTVFDRLADPENYTGTQKQVQLRNKSRPRSRAPSLGLSDNPKVESATAPREILQKRHSSKNMERDDGAVTMERQSSSVRSRSRAGSRVRSSHPRETKSVGRLSASAKSRGTQLSRRDENASKNPSRNRQPQPANNDHGEENVFERLSNQTTFAFSIRQNGAPDEGVGQQQHPPRLNSVDAMLDEVLGTPPYHGHDSPDVFERLTKTTTEAYAMKRKNEV